MRVIIAGSRNITDMKYVEDAIAAFSDPIAYPNPETRPKITEVVCGEAKGVDTLGKHWALTNNIPVKSFPADWNKHGKAAGYKRNKDMAEYADALIAVWDNKSRGTLNMINIAKEKGLPFLIRYVYEDEAKRNHI